MAYKVHNYQSGAKLFASQLNEMDNQIQIVDDFLFYGNQQKTDEWYAELEPYSISSANGQNTSSAYAKYYRTKGYLSGVEEIVVNGTTQIYNVMFYRADYSYIGDLGAWAYDGGRKLTYPDDAVYIRVCGYVSTTNDPINLASVFVKCIKHITTENNLKTYLVDKIDDVSNVANTLYEDINGIYAYTAPQDTNKNRYFVYEFKAGETYIIHPSSYMNMSTGTSPSSAALQSQVCSGGRDTEFYCLVNASYCRFYVADGFTVTIKKKSAIRQATEYAYLQVNQMLDGVPYYYKSHIASKINTIRANMNACGRNGETFVFITDPHWQQNQHNSPYLIREVLNKTSINYVVCGGDLIGEGEHDPMVNLMHECVRALTIEGHKTYFAFGNHDSNWNAYGGQREHPERHFDNDTVWALISKPNDNAVVWMDGDRQNYYFDNSGTKTRTIIIDTGEDDSAAGLPLFTEFDELAAALMGTPEGWHIIIVGHIVTYGVMVNEVPKMCDAYNSKGTYATYDFASAKAKVSLLLGGHIHNDASRVSTGGIPIVATDCDSTATNTTSPAYAAGTVTQHCFDVVTVDYKSKKAKFVRIGRGADRIFDIP